MTSNNESHSNVVAILKDVYVLAETLFLMSGGEVLEGCSFSRSLGELAEYCYSCASIVVYNEAARDLHA